MRLPDWEQRLADVVAAHQGGVFVWGSRDCFTFVRETVFRLTDQCIWPEIRYGGPRQATVRLRRHGFRTVSDALADVLPEVPPALARAGDVGVVIEGNAEAGVVVLGAEIVGMAPGRGLTVLPLVRLHRAFRVG
ncbi:hypothetical protein V5F32_04830 [Xanthobacter oligotrophicus]|uniref:DUF6950 domain-containing protein n=1 Tax=Xanthobacter oligotrophicus TaxID=2607286 RepID=A0ABW6ZSS4_9HYPH